MENEKKTYGNTLENEVLKDDSHKEVNNKLNYKSNQFSIYQAKTDLLDIQKYLDSDENEYSIFKSNYNTDVNLIMPGIDLNFLD